MHCRPMRTFRILFVAVVASILGGAAGTGVALGLRDDGSTTTTSTVALSGATAEVLTGALSASEIYRRAADSVAYVTAREAQSDATGTGFVVDADGLIVTNAHVIDGADEISVKLGHAAAHHGARRLLDQRRPADRRGAEPR